MLVVISYLWFDRPIALWVHSHIRSAHQGALAHFAFRDPFLPLAAILFVVIGLRVLIARPLPRYQAAAFLCSVSVLCGEAIKDLLKFVFSRTWPETWIHNNPSFIRDGVYGFYFFHGGTAYQSFPSGHMGAVCAAISVLWIWYPRWWLLWAMSVLGAGAALVGTNYHFLSDVIAGGFVGASIGCIATAVWRGNPAATRGIAMDKS